jgi:hypothetical protein
MSATQFFPISPEMFALANETVSRRVSRLPFLRGGVRVTGELIGVTMECLNAEFTKILPLTTPRDAPDGVIEGLDQCLEQRLGVPGKVIVPVIAEVLIGAEIAEYTEVLDRQLHRPRKGIKLLTPWTWNAVASMAQAAHLSDGITLSWMSMCPVCKTGILNKVIGKQLFGIPRTDFIIECTHCGAKFIPVGTQFRLVSIATIRDPLWKKHLDKTYSAEIWSALARGTSVSGNTPVYPAVVKTIDPCRIPSSGFLLTKMKDGSLAVPFREKTLFFKPVKLNFSGGVKEDLFAREQKLLNNILENPVYENLRQQVNARYPRYLPLKTGLFLSQLKERHDPFYREFLNSYGDEKYGTFRLEESNDAGKRGVLIVVITTGMYYAADCPDTFRAMVNDTFGRISPEICYRTGDATRCRINALICNNRKEAGMYVHVCDNDIDRIQITENLRGCLPPEWR